MIFQAFHNISTWYFCWLWLFSILQKFDFSSKSKRTSGWAAVSIGCLRYCKSTIFQANHNINSIWPNAINVVCDTAKVRFFKQITTSAIIAGWNIGCLRYCKSTIFQANHNRHACRIVRLVVVCDTAKVRFFKQITTALTPLLLSKVLFAILQKYDFSSKSQQYGPKTYRPHCCLRYCKSTIFQANHNIFSLKAQLLVLFAILQKYDFSSKSQLRSVVPMCNFCCLRYCKSTIFQANHNPRCREERQRTVVCDTAKVRFFKQITTRPLSSATRFRCLRYCKSTIFQANHNFVIQRFSPDKVVCDTAKVRFFKQITTPKKPFL